MIINWFHTVPKKKKNTSLLCLTIPTVHDHLQPEAAVYEIMKTYEQLSNHRSLSLSRSLSVCVFVFFVCMYRSTDTLHINQWQNRDTHSLISTAPVSPYWGLNQEGVAVAVIRSRACRFLLSLQGFPPSTLWQWVWGLKGRCVSPVPEA